MVSKTIIEKLRKVGHKHEQIRINRIKRRHFVHYIFSQCELSI